MGAGDGELERPVCCPCCLLRSFWDIRTGTGGLLGVMTIDDGVDVEVPLEIAGRTAVEGAENGLRDLDCSAAMIDRRS